MSIINVVAFSQLDRHVSRPGS